VSSRQAGYATWIRVDTVGAQRGEAGYLTVLSLM
jgi:hypothetical protein